MKKAKILALLFSFIIIILASSCSDQSSGNAGSSSSNVPSKPVNPARVISENEKIIQELRDSGYIHRGVFLLTEEGPIRYEEFLPYDYREGKIPSRNVGENSNFAIIIYDINPDYFDMFHYLRNKKGSFYLELKEFRKKIQSTMTPVETEYGKYYIVRPRTSLEEGEVYGVCATSCYEPFLKK